MWPLTCRRTRPCGFSVNRTVSNISVTLTYIWFHSASFISSLPLSVSDPPSVSIEGYDNNWYVGRSGAVLLCQANANPPPTNVTWTA